MISLYKSLKGLWQGLGSNRASSDTGLKFFESWQNAEIPTVRFNVEK